MTKVMLSVLVVVAFGALLFVLHPSPSLFLLAALLLLPARQFRAMGLALLAASLLLLPTTAALHLLGHLLLSNARPVVDALSILVMLAALLFVRPDFASPKKQNRGGGAARLSGKVRLPRRAPTPAPVPAAAMPALTGPFAMPQPGVMPTTGAPQPGGAVLTVQPRINTQPVPLLKHGEAPTPASMPISAPSLSQGDGGLLPPDC